VNFDLGSMAPIDTTGWAGGLAGQGGLVRTGLRALPLNRAGSELSRSALREYALTGYGAKAFRWNAGDDSVADWLPQGICGIRLDDPRLSMVLVSWHSEHPGTDKGVRVSFVDVTPGSSQRFRYRHVLLVQRAEGSAGFAPVEIHAGGIGYSKGFLHVADTYKGVRSFDLSNLYGGLAADDGKSRIGFSGGKAYAFDYRYILPQSYHYDRLYDGLVAAGYSPHGRRPKFSYASMDWTGGDRGLLTGSYVGKSAWNNGIRPTMFLWRLDPTNAQGTLARVAPRDLGIPAGLKRFRYIQGAARFGSKLYVSRSAGLGVHRHTLSGSWSRDDFAIGSQRTRIVPSRSGSVLGFEDLHLSQSSDRLWGLSEGNRDNAFVGDRIVFWIRGVK
jgi:hypothetical protein